MAKKTMWGNIFAWDLSKDRNEEVGRLLQKVHDEYFDHEKQVGDKIIYNEANSTVLLKYKSKVIAVLSLEDETFCDSDGECERTIYLFLKKIRRSDIFRQHYKDAEEGDCLEHFCLGQWNCTRGH